MKKEQPKKKKKPVKKKSNYFNDKIIVIGFVYKDNVPNIRNKKYY
jgi:UDP-N-acetyl-D-mannosaminuronate dehydrogenase